MSGDPLPESRVSTRGLMVTVLIVFVCCTVFAQRTDRGEDSLVSTTVPKVVMKGFKSRYPLATPSYWVQEDEDYEAQFTVNGKVMTAEFSRRGKWLNSEIVMEPEELPAMGVEYIRKNYEGYEVNAIIFEESPLGKFYSVGLANDENYEELIFDALGNFVTKGDYVD